MNQVYPDRESFVILPIHDVGFKALFGHHSDPECELLKDFLEAIFARKFDAIVFEDREITAEQVYSKSIRLDLRLYIESTYFNLEMQIVPIGNEPERALYYLAMSISDQHLSGKSYDRLEGVHQIFLMAENSSHFTEPVEHFQILNTATHTPLTDKANFTMISLRKVIETISDSSMMTPLQKWCLFLANWGKNESSEAMKILYQEEKFRKAGEIMHQINRDKALKEAAFVKMREEMDMKTRLVNAEKNGEKLGDSLRQMKTAFQLMSMGMDNSFISKAVELAEEKVAELRQEFELQTLQVAEKTVDYSVEKEENEMP